MEVFSLFDRKMREYQNLVLANNGDAVQRALKESLSKAGPGTTVVAYAEDFDLYRLGFFDPDTGVLVPEKVPVMLVCVAALLENGDGDAGNGQTEER